MKKTYFLILGMRGFLTSLGQSVQVRLKSTITLAVLSLLTFGPLTTFAQNVPYKILVGHTGIDEDVVFSSDGGRLASENEDDTVRLWWLTTTRGSIHFELSTVVPPSVGAQMTINLAIVGGEHVAGYQTSVSFDSTALRYIKSATGDYLSANAFFAQPKLEGNKVTLASTSGTIESTDWWDVKGDKEWDAWPP